jgi:hypothetical protein
MNPWFFRPSSVMTVCSHSSCSLLSRLLIQFMPRLSLEEKKTHRFTRGRGRSRLVDANKSARVAVAKDDDDDEDFQQDTSSDSEDEPLDDNMMPGGDEINTRSTKKSRTGKLVYSPSSPVELDLDALLCLLGLLVHPRTFMLTFRFSCSQKTGLSAFSTILLHQIVCTCVVVENVRIGNF